KTTDTGAPLIQVSGNVEHGDSGGPALDSTGRVVGIVSFGIGTQGSTSFLQASNSAQQLVQQLNLNTTPGAFQTAWSQAFNDYSVTDAGHWHKAARELQQLATTYPQFKGINPFLTYAQQQAKTEKVAATPTATSTPTTTSSSASSFLANNWPLLAGGALIVLAIVFFGTLIVKSRSKKTAQATSKQSYGAPSTMGYPYTSPINQGAPPARALPQTPPHGQPTYPSQSPNVSHPSMPFGTPPVSQPPVWPGPSAPQPSAWPAPPSSPQQTLPGQGNRYTPGASGTSSAAGDRTQIMVHWPCGHMNVPNARFCSKCGEPARHTPPIRRYEQ
ncbi:MAG TPA: trypsin-like serine protease, partial [Ktedonobacteraceae bacterium]